MAEHTDHVPPEFVVNVIRAGALCVEAPRMIAFAAQSDWPLEPPRCPTRIVWGTEDKLLPWPAAAARYRRDSCRTPTGSSSTASATVLRWTCRSITAELILGAIA